MNDRIHVPPFLVLASDREQKHCKSALGTILLVGTAGGKAGKVLLVPTFYESTEKGCTSTSA